LTFMMAGLEFFSSDEFAQLLDYSNWCWPKMESLSYHCKHERSGSQTSSK
jgi:hypothetical protein